MRLFVSTALSLFATPALACGMFIPADMLIAGIDELMLEVDAVEVAAVPLQPNQVVWDANAADEALLAALVKPRVQLGVAVEMIPEAAAELAEITEIAPLGLTRERRQEMKPRARSATM